MKFGFVAVLGAALITACGRTNASTSPDASLSTVRGEISVDQSEVATGSSASASAWFGVPDGCHPFESVAGCFAMMNLCSPTRSPPEKSAGTLMFGGLTSALVLVPAASTPLYPARHEAASLFAEGSSVSVDASGDEIPSFTGTITPHAQVRGASKVASVDRSTDLALTWTPSAGTVRATFITTEIDATSGDVYCDFDASAGSATVPSAALSMLAPTSGAGTALFMLGSRDELEIDATGVPVVFALSQTAVFSDGSVAFNDIEVR